MQRCAAPSLLTVRWAGWQLVTVVLYSQVFADGPHIPRLPFALPLRIGREQLAIPVAAILARPATSNSNAPKWLWKQEMWALKKRPVDPGWVH